MQKLILYVVIFSNVIACSDTDELELVNKYIEDCHPEELGIGVIYMDMYHTELLDTSYVYTEPNYSSDQLTKWFAYSIYLEDTIIRNALFSVSSEFAGYPVIEINEDWIQIIYGYDSMNIALTGWVKHNKIGLLIYEDWTSFFEAKAQFFRRCVTPAFYDAINGNEILLDLDYSHDERVNVWWPDYHFYSIQNDGDWMEVLINSPSQYCASDTSEYRSDTLWIRYIDENGSPNVSFYAAGC